MIYFRLPMNKIILIIIFVAVFTGAYAFAEESEHVQVFGRDLGVEAGFEVSHITYTEPGVMREQGFMCGVTGAMAYRNYNYMLSVEARASMGQVDYSSGDSGSMDNINDDMLEVRGLAGYDVHLSETLAITPYFGLGYRHLDDNMGGKISTLASYGYDREISYIYSPIGADITTSLENGWNLKLRVEYDCFWKGTVASHLGDIPGYYNIENRQDKGMGIRSSLMFKKKGEAVDFIIEPFFRYWSIKQSKDTMDPGGATWIEPKNNSMEFGINLSAEY